MTVEPLRDYVSWHAHYDDPSSGLSWRLGVVQRYLDQALDRHPGSVRLLSLCAGDGRDVVGVLGNRTDTDRVRAVLVELHPGIADSARAAVHKADLDMQVEVRVADAGAPCLYADAFPADLVLLVGIFGNISDEDLWRTVDAAPQFCTPGATLVWSRGRHLTDRNDQIRARFAENGFTELDYDERNEDSRPALGAMRYDGPAQPMSPEPPFQFLR